MVIVNFFNIEYDVSHKTTKSFAPLMDNYKGTNIAGGEFNPGPGKRCNHDYFYPNPKAIDYYASKGLGIIRMPFDLTRAYPIPYSALNVTEIDYMLSVVDYCLLKGMRVLLNPHNYGFIYDNRTGIQRAIGIDPEGTNMFADFWSRMGATYKNYSNVVFGLMNEPHQQTAGQWYAGAVPAIKAIRAVNATQLILIPGSSWTGAHSWNSSGNAAIWTGFTDDPLNNFAFEMHQYLDNDSSGQHNTCAINCSTRLEDATTWLINNKYKGFLAEFAWTTDPSCLNESVAFMDYLSLNSNVWLGWTWWCGGPWSPTDYMFMLNPANLTPPLIDRPQMAVLLAHL